LGPRHPDVAIDYNNLGEAYRTKGNYDRAISYYKKSLEINIKKLGLKHPNVALSYNNLGLAYNSKGNYDRAIFYYKKSLVLKLDSLGPKHPNVALSYNNLGEAYRAKGDYKKAISYHEKALAISIKTLGSEHPNVALSYNNLGLAYNGMGSYNRAIFYYEKALTIKLKSLGSENPNVALSYNNLGEAYRAKGDYEKAISYHEKALAISIESLGSEHPNVALSYNNLGLAYDCKGNYDRAISYFEKSLGIDFKAFGPVHPNVATTYNNLGEAYRAKGDYNRAISYYEKALAINIKTLGAEHPNMAFLYNNLGSAYNGKENYNRAISYYEKSLEIACKILGPEHPDVATSYNNLGAVYENKGDYNRAISYYKKSLVITIKALGSGHPNVTTLYNNLGKAYCDKGNYDRAISYYKKALPIKLNGLDPEHPNVGMSFNNLGGAYENKGDYNRAIFYYKKALAIIKKTTSRQDVILVASNIGLLYMKKNQFTNAKACFQEGINVIEKARLEMGARKSEFMGRNIKIYQYDLKTYILMGDTVRAFQMAETMKERGFLDQLSLNAALNSEGINPKDRNQGMELVQAIESSNLRLQNEINKPESKQDKTSIRNLSDDLEAKEKEFIALDEKLMKNERYRNLRHPSITTLENAQALCDDSTAILDYVIWEGTDKERQPYCLVITKNGFKIIELPRDFEYSKTIKTFKQAVTLKDKDVTDIDQKSTLLYANLIKPLEGSLAGIKRLIVVPDGTLAFLPFDALKNKDTSRYLGEDYLISLSPSVSVLSMIKQRNFSPKRSQFLAFGGAYYAEKLSENRGGREGIPESEVSEKLEKYYAQRSAAEGMSDYCQALGLKWGYLRGTLDEVNTIKSKIFNQKDNKIITGPDVSEAKVKELSKNKELSKYRIVHFACHGYYNPVYPSLSSIVFSEVSGLIKSSEDGYLSVEEAALLDLNADIVNLSACETGLGKIAQGDGVIGLTRAFQVAGANMVGVTLWTVDDEATKQYMISIYEKVYKQKKSYVEAYAETKREFMHSKQYSQFSSPSYWSPFVLYGQ
jgi:tetratricopeptide (TPR) repeat protein